MTIVAAADGSALGNPGPAGWAWYVDENCWRAGGWDHGTNNMGELMAVLDLFRSTAHLPEEPLHILCDSQYVINSVTKWMPGWKRKGWKKSDGKPVLNLDLLKEIDAALVGRNYTFEWVKGHAGHDLNEAADDRARDAATAHQAKRKPNAGPGFPGAALAEKSDAGTRAAAVSAPPRAPSKQATAVRPEAVIFGEEPDLFSLLDDEIDPAFVPATEGEPAAVERLERELLDPEVRADPLRVAELLHPEFQEIGVSGRMYSRQQILDLLADKPAGAIDFELIDAQELSAESVLLRYRSSHENATSLRTSLWLLHDGQWRLRHHQGTSEA